VNTVGDSVVATSDGPGRAVECALAIRDAMRALGLEVRAGLHTGEIELRGDDIGGIAVHVAARVLGHAAGGEVVTSAAVPQLVAGSAIRFEDRGEHELKGIPGRGGCMPLTHDRWLRAVSTDGIVGESATVFQILSGDRERPCACAGVEPEKTLPGATRNGGCPQLVCGGRLSSCSTSSCSVPWLCSSSWPASRPCPDSGVATARPGSTTRRQTKKRKICDGTMP
jgi:hypothetical protein